jgi:hypothetical protein
MSGEYLLTLGKGKGSDMEQFNRPWGVAAGCGAVFVADRLNHLIKVRPVTDVAAV